MSSVAERLRERRLNVWEQAKGLAERVSDENRNFTAEEQGTYEALDEELNTLDSRIKSVLDQEKRARDADAQFEAVHRNAAANGKKVTDRGGAAYTEDDDKLADEFRKLLRGEINRVEVGQPTAAERRALRMGTEQRVVTTGSAPMPTSFVGQLYQYLVDNSSIRGCNPTVYTTTSGEALTVPRSTAEGSATWFGENVQITESAPTLSSITLNAYKVGKTLYVSRELLDDTGFDLLGYIADHSGRNIGIAIDAAYVAGDGTAKPTGIIAASGGASAIAMVTGTATGFPAAPAGGDPLIDAFHSVIPQYRRNASWLMNDASVKLARKIKDTTGNFLWQPGLVAGAPDTLLGRPLFADPNMATFVNGAKVIAFGDFRSYAIRDVTPMRFERSDDFKFDTDLVSFKVVYRTDGKMLDQNGLKVFTATT